MEITKGNLAFLLFFDVWSGIQCRVNARSPGKFECDIWPSPPPQHESTLPTWGFISTQFKSLPVAREDTRCALPRLLPPTFISETQLSGLSFLARDRAHGLHGAPWRCLSLLISCRVNPTAFVVPELPWGLQTVMCLLPLLSVSWGRSL